MSEKHIGALRTKVDKLEEKLKTQNKKILSIEKNINRQLKKPTKRPKKKSLAKSLNKKEDTQLQTKLAREKVLSDKDAVVLNIGNLRRKDPVKIMDHHYSFDEVAEAGQQEKLKAYADSLGSRKPLFLGRIKNKAPAVYERFFESQ